MNSLEDTFFHHGFVAQSIEEPETKVVALFRGRLKPRNLAPPASASCSAVNRRAGLRACGPAAQGTGEELGGKERRAQGTGRAKNWEHPVKEGGGQTEGRGGQKRNFHGRERLCLPFPGPSIVPLKQNQTKRQQKELNHLWDDFVGARNLPLD